MAPYSQRFGETFYLHLHGEVRGLASSLVGVVPVHSPVCLGPLFTIWLNLLTVKM
jgi:hypothetical protein